MTALELKPCPFCGRGAEFSLGKTGDGKDWHYTECVNCGATGPLVNYADHNIAINDALADAWNRRADLAAVQPAQVRVKPLVWEEPCYTNNWIHVARSVFGDYYISIDGGRHSVWMEFQTTPFERQIGDDVGSVIEAMMIAERDYEAKTRALIIEPQPDQRGEALAFDSADWYWRTMDPDDSGETPNDAVCRGMLGQFCVCEIASSYRGPTRYGFLAPVLDPENDDEEFVHFATHEEAMEAAKARAALAAEKAVQNG